MSESTALKFVQFWRSVGAVLVMGAVIVSLIPAPYKFSTSHMDKLWHAITYAGLMFWFAQLYGNAVHWRLALGFVALGAVIEGLQHLTGYRMAEVADAIANTVGVLLGWALFRTPLGRMLRHFDRLLARARKLPSS